MTVRSQSVGSDLQNGARRVLVGLDAKPVKRWLPTPEGWRDNIVETSRYRVTTARLLVDEQEFAKAAELARAVISDLDGEQPTTVLADAYGVLSDAALGAGDIGGGERYRATAMSLYLAAGLTQEAHGLAAHFLEPATRSAAHVPAEEATDTRRSADT